jgi:hypothetical protein
MLFILFANVSYIVEAQSGNAKACKWLKGKTILLNKQKNIS